MKRLLPLALLTFGLAACSAIDEAEMPIASTSCPQVAVIRDLSVYQHPPRSDETNLVVSARMGNIQGGCSIDKNTGTVKAGFDVVALRGINTAGRRAVLPFFVSVLDTKDTVVKKETYEIPVVFDGAQRLLTMHIPVNPNIAAPAGEDPSQYRVLIGFQLSSEQVDANAAYFGSKPFAKP
jgi:hypothetical protein